MKDDGRLEREAWEFIQRLNRTWTSEGRPERLSEFFHPEMVAVSPSSRDRSVGRQACIAAWKEFADAAKIRGWRETEPRITVFNNGKTAVVTYNYRITFQMGGRSVTSNGRDMYVLVREGDRWWAVADQFQENP
jgi:ketosteroid isomerase-like protein